MRTLILTFCILLSSFSWAEGVENDFEGLGGNKILLDRAKDLQAEQNVSIVQDRLVPRRKVWEFDGEVAGSFGGDTYSKTQAYGIGVQYHLTPYWSLGLKYMYDMNKLTAEGDTMVGRALDDYAANPHKPTAPVPSMDYPKSETFALINWYPIYGKVNLLDRGIAHFDFYVLAGYGQVELNSGPTKSTTAGGGVGVWWTRHLSTRLEMRYQNYKAKYFESETNLDLAVASVQMGWML